MNNKEEYIVIQRLDYRYTLPDEPPKCAIINSNGGQNQYATPVYDYIRIHKLNTIAEGSCQSFGFTLFTAGEQRISYPSTLFMIHGFDVVDKHSKKNSKNAIQKFKECFYNNWLERLESISNKDKNWWNNLMQDANRHVHFTAKELYELGIVTKIISYE